MNDCLSKCSYSLPWRVPGSVPSPPTQRGHTPVAFILHANPLELCYTYNQIIFCTFGSITVTHKGKNIFLCGCGAIQMLIKPQKGVSTKSETYSEPSWTSKTMEPFAILRSSNKTCYFKIQGRLSRIKVFCESKFSLNGRKMVTTEDGMSSHCFTYFINWLMDLALVKKRDNLKFYQTFQFWLY